MPTNEERKAIAAIMRDFTRFSVSSCAVASRLGFDCEEYANCYICEQELADRLADLIEPEERTCRNVGYYSDSTRFECSECEFNGWVKWAKDGKDRVPGYCPNCGSCVEEEA